MYSTPKETLYVNINELQAQGYEVDDDNKPVHDIILNPETQQGTPTYKSWVWGGIDHIKSAVHRHERDRLSGFGEESLR